MVGVDGGSYTFNASLKTVTFAGVTVTQKQILLIVNTTRGVIIYSPIITAKKGTLAALVLTLDFDTSAFADADDLQIFLEVQQGTQPVSLSNANGLQGTPANPYGIAIYDNQTSSRAIVDQNGAIKFGEAIILVGDVLYGQALSSSLWGSLSINGGTTTGGAGEQLLNTGTTANGEVILQSRKRSRFMISQFNIAHFGIQLVPADLTDPNLVIEWGCYDPIHFPAGVPTVNATSNGIFFRVDGGAWSIVSVKNGVETSVPQASWNGVNAPMFNAAPNLSVYEIQYNAGTAIFFQGSNFIHRLSGLTSTYAASYNFPVVVRIRNKNGSIVARSIGCRAAGTYRLGEERGEVISRVFSANTLIKTGAGYCSHAFLSRTGSAGGSATLFVYDGIDATGFLMARIDIGADDLKGIEVSSTFSNGLYIKMTGSGTTNATIGFE